VSVLRDKGSFRFDEMLLEPAYLGLLGEQDVGRYGAYINITAIGEDRQRHLDGLAVMVDHLTRPFGVRVAARTTDHPVRKVRNSYSHRDPRSDHSKMPVSCFGH
jgi:hypothetical protein